MFEKFIIITCLRLFIFYKTKNFFFVKTKIKDRFWVLDECLLRVADDFDSTEELIKYGLLGTSWEVLQNIDSEKSMQHYIEPQLDDKDVKLEKVFSGV